MDFPRFQSGQIGNLTYAHLNEAFSLLDRLRPLLIAAGEEGVLGEAMLVARITGGDASTGLMQWVEVVPSSASVATAQVTWTTRVGGRKSGAPTDANFDPCVVPPQYQAEGSASIPSTLTTNSVVVLRKMKRIGGKSLWVVFSTVAAASDNFPARITGWRGWPPEVNGSFYRYLYDWEEVTTNSLVERLWVTLNPPIGRRGSLLNISNNSGAALNVSETAGVIGVGGSGPAEAAFQYSHIAVGVIVDMNLRLPNGTPQPWFSAGPAIAVSCAG
jgi:hypothetical protein